MTDIDPSTAVVLALPSLVISIAVYVWTALALAAVFGKSGLPGWKAWVPVLNLIVLLRLGGVSPWLLLLGLIPGLGLLAVWILLVMASYRINVSFGFGVGMTVLAAISLPIWATVLGFGSARWLGSDAEEAVGPRRTQLPGPYVPSAAAAFAPVAPVAPVDSGSSVPPAAPAAPVAPVDSAGPLSYVAPSAPAAPAASAAPAGLPPVVAPPASTPTESSSFAGTPPISSAPVDATPSFAPAPEPFTPPPVSFASVPAPASAPPRTAAPLDPEFGDEATSEVTAAVPGAPRPVSAVPGPDELVRQPVFSPPPVTRVPAAPAPATSEPWAPRRSSAEADAFAEPSAELSGEVSAIIGAPDAGSPRSALGAVSAQHAQLAQPDVSEEFIDETIITRRGRPAWVLELSSGPPVALRGGVVILGRKPSADAAFPGAQLVAVDDGTVSKTHARLELRDDRWYITDLGSTNGVLFATLMGTEVEATPGVEIEAGERFYLGDAEVRLQRSDG